MKLENFVDPHTALRNILGVVTAVSVVMIAFYILWPPGSYEKTYHKKFVVDCMDEKATLPDGRINVDILDKVMVECEKEWLEHLKK
jgi:hypothetical protein